MALPFKNLFVKSLILEVASPRGGRAGLQAGGRGRCEQAAGGEARRQSAAGGPRQDGQCQFSIGFYRSKWPSHSKTHRKITSFEGWGNPSRGHGGNPPRGHGGNPPRGRGGNPPRGRGGNPPRGREGAMAPPTVAGRRVAHHKKVCTLIRVHWWSHHEK